MVVLAIALLVAYGVGVRRLARRGRRWSRVRVACAVGAALAMAAAGLIPGTSFVDHTTEHLLLGIVGPLLFALGAPLTLLLQAGSAETSRLARRLLRWPPLAVLTHPLVGFSLFGVSMVVLYLSPLLELSQRNEAVHVLVHLHLVVVGSLFLWPLVGADPTPRRTPHGARMLAVLAAVPFHAFLGLALLTATDPIAPDAYPSIDDQHRAAALLWGSGELLTLAVAAVVFRAWYAADRREAMRLDRRLDAATVPAEP